MRIAVDYPSGKRVILVGDFLGPGYVDGGPDGPVWRRVNETDGWPATVDDDGKAVMILLTKASYINGQQMKAAIAVMLDPRAVCEDDETGERLCAPSLLTPGTCRWVVDWLQEHPTWPPATRGKP